MIKNFLVIGDSELVVQQIKTSYASKNKRLKQYRNAIWDEIEVFDAFGITWMDISNNKMADLLANVEIKPNDDSFIGIYIIEVQNRPSIPNNTKNWQVFEDDNDILQFLLLKKRYDSQELEYSAFVETCDGKQIVFGQEILQLKTNKLPKGSVMLDSTFDSQDRFTVKVKCKKN